VFNHYNGNYAAGRQGVAYNPTTGRFAAGQKGVVGNAYNGTAHSVDRGVAGNVKTGNAVGWNHGNVYSDHDGNIHGYSNSGERSTYDSGGWRRDIASSSSWGDRFGGMDRESCGRSLGAQRFDAFRRGGWGGFRGGGRFRR
jgi:hypothetical protein